MPPRVFGAVDLGASGGRVMAGIVDGDGVTLEPIHRFPNLAVMADGHLRWDVDTLFTEVRSGLAALRTARPNVESIGIDTWGVDYGLLDTEGELLAAPISHRDDRTAGVIDDVHALVSPEELYAINGLQFLPFTTVYQLAAEQKGPSWADAAQLALIPDLLAHHLTGELRTERTNASTTGLLDVHTGEWSIELLERLGVPPALLTPLDSPGEVRGMADGVTVTTVGSHDTASAVVAVPATTDRFAYVVSGTWSLVGVELDRPVLTEAARAANFTNEGGVDGRTRFLRNVGGLWLLQESMRSWGRADLANLLAEASRIRTGGPVIDVDDDAFIAPGGMPDRIVAAAGQEAMSPAETVRCIIESLAAAYARTIEHAVDLAGVAVDVIHVVGGGSQNELLCQLTADRSRRPVIAGPVEATALGNVLVQARTHGAVPASLEAIRTSLASTTTLHRYEPR